MDQSAIEAKLKIGGEAISAERWGVVLNGADTLLRVYNAMNTGVPVSPEVTAHEARLRERAAATYEGNKALADDADRIRQSQAQSVLAEAEKIVNDESIIAEAESIMRNEAAKLPAEQTKARDEDTFLHVDDSRQAVEAALANTMRPEPRP